MNKQMMIIVGVVVLALAGGAFVLSQQSAPSTSTEAMMEKTDDALKKDEGMMETTPAETMMKDEGAMMEKTESYVPYTASALADASSNKRVLFFYANWCPTCKPADAAFQERSETIPSGVTVIRVNYNDTETEQEEKDLAKKYQVTYQHTFVQIDETGNEVTKWNGGGLEELIQNIQ